MLRKVKGKDGVGLSDCEELSGILLGVVSDCEELVEDLFREERGNDLQRDLREMMRLVEL